MATKHVDKSGRVVDGAAPWETQTRSKLAEKIGNLRAARKAGARPEGGMKLDNPDMARRTEIHQMCNPTPAPDFFATGRKIRPQRGVVFARREPAYTSTAVIIPDGANYFPSQGAVAFYEILAVGPGVEFVSVGDRVMAGSAVAQDLRGLLGPEVWALKAPEWECPSGTQYVHGTGDAYRDTDASGGACQCTGMILAVVEG